MNECLEEILRETAYAFTRRNANKMTTIAEALGVATSYVYRVISPDDNAANLRANQLVSFMTATESLAPLRFIAGRMNCAVVPLPKVKERLGRVDLQRIHKSLSEMLGELSSYVSSHCDEDAAEAAIDSALEVLVGAREQIRRYEVLRFDNARRNLYEDFDDEKEQ